MRRWKVKIEELTLIILQIGLLDLKERLWDQNCMKSLISAIIYLKTSEFLLISYEKLYL